MHRFAYVLLSIITAACSSSPRRIVLNPGTQPQVEPGGGGTAPVVGQPTTAGAAASTPIQRLNQVDAHLTQRGFSRVGPAVRNANMQAGGLVAYAINTAPGQCYVAVAIGVSGSDLNMIVLDPMGRTVAHNVLPDETPWVRICPTMAGRFISRLQMATGGGEYYYALYQGTVQNEPMLEAALGGAQPAQQVQQAQIDPQTNQRLTALDNQFTQERFSRVGPPMGVQLATGADDRRQINLQQGSCYAFASLGGPGANDTDIYILNGSEETMQSDRDTDLDAVVRFCPPASGTYTLRANMYRGAGPIFIAGWVQQQAQAPSQPNVAPAPAAPVLATTSTAGGGVNEAYALLDADMLARGYESFGSMTRGELQQGGTRDFNIELEGGKCYAIVAVGGSTVRNLDLTLMNASGNELDRDIADDARPIVRVCPENSGRHRMQVKMTEGTGNFVYHAYRWPRGTRGPFGLSGLIYVRLAEVTSLLQVEGFQPSADFAPGRGRLRRQGASGGHNIDLPSGKCFAVLVVGGDGVNDIDVSLNKGRNRLAADGSRNPFPNVRHCTTQAGAYRLNIEAANGSGSYFYQVFERGSGS